MNNRTGTADFTPSLLDDGLAVIRRCKCGKVIYKGADSAMKEARKQPSRLPMWAYECHVANKGDFHLTTHRGSTKYKVTANVELTGDPQLHRGASSE